MILVKNQVFGRGFRLGPLCLPWPPVVGARGLTEFPRLVGGGTIRYTRGIGHLSIAIASGDATKSFKPGVPVVPARFVEGTTFVAEVQNRL